MDYQTLFNIVLGGFSTLAGWLLNILYNSMKELTKADQVLADKVQAIELVVAGQYIPRAEFEQKMSALFDKLERIDNKLDQRRNLGRGS